MNSVFDRPATPPGQPAGQRFFGGAVAFSLLLHAVIGVALIARVDRQLPENQETPILVELVPPPEPEELEPKELEPEELEPEPETSETEPTPKPEEQPQSEERLAAAPPLPVLRPVYEFAETDTGPQREPDGVLAKEPKEADQDEPEQLEPDADVADEKQGTNAEPSEVSRNEAVETPNEQEPEQPQVSESGLQSEQVADAEANPGDLDTIGPIATVIAPTPEAPQNPADAAPEEAEDPDAMIPAKHLFSEAIREDPSFRTAMAGMPRSMRANLLCMTEMRDQLRAADRAPEVLPSFRLPAGTVMQPGLAAFRTRGQWFDLAFRCEVDPDVTRVLNFSYRIGDAIPRSQWAQRGFPNL